MKRNEKGSTLIEVLVALALLGIISVLFLSSMANSTTARVTADTRVSAKILAESLIDDIKKQEYEPSYDITVPPEFYGYSANLTVQSMANGNIQKLIITIEHLDREVLTLESFKVER
ncbi:MAG: type II secretion system protein [Dehalococcoidales bacterium]|nr:type II secretion system protein [Dehalococcoidales bacterium]